MSPEDLVAPMVERAMWERPDRAVVIGICGAQGSGKSTLAAALSARIDGTVTLSLDDLYLTRAERLRLATEVHPLLRTRGVPGTHDIDLGLRVLGAIQRGEATALPRFSKALDDRLPESAWPIAPGGTRAVLLEGWCVGARPQADAALVEAVNALERDRDPAGTWRRFANAALAGRYQTLFAELDKLILLAAPDWDAVLAWRLEQEDALRHSGAKGVGVMDAAAVGLFVSHYERLTRHILGEVPARADLLLRLGRDRTLADHQDASRCRSAKAIDNARTSMEAQVNEIEIDRAGVRH